MRALLLHGAAAWCCRMVLLHGAAVWCCCMVLLHGAAAWCCCILLLHGAAAWCRCCCSSSNNFLIYEIEAAVEAAPTIFGRYLVTLWRQLLAAADAFRAEHWVQSFAGGLSVGELSSAPIQESRARPSSPFRRQLRGLNF